MGKKAKAPPAENKMLAHESRCSTPDSPCNTAATTPGTMPWGSKNIFSGPQFKFLVGPEGKEYSVHRGAFTEISPVLRALMTGKMSEAAAGQVVWDDTEEATFKGLVEFAYTRSYSVPAPGDNDLLQSTYPEPDAWVDVDSFKKICMDAGNYIDPMYSADGPKLRAALYSMRDFPAPANSPSWKHEPLAKLPLDQDYTNVFLHQAKLYILADKYDVPDLRHLVLHNVSHILLRFRDSWNAIPAFVALVEVVYTNTLVADHLRNLLAIYSTAVLKFYYRHPEFSRTLRTCPDFAADIVEKVAGWERVGHPTFDIRS